VADDDVRSPSDQALWDGRRRRQEGPDPVPESELPVCSAERLTGGDDVEHHETEDDLRVVEGHPVGAPRTAVLADDVELVVPQRVCMTSTWSRAISRILYGA
jgi:hypothetical protein